MGYKYYEVKQQLDNQQQTTLPSPQLVIGSPSPVSSPITEVNQTANWKLYTSPNGWQVKYPASHLRLICPGEELTLTNKGIEDKTDPIEMSTCARGGRYQVEGKTYNEVQDEPEETKYYKVEKKPVEIGKFQATQYIFTFTNIEEGPFPEWYTLAHLNKDGKTIEFYFDEKDLLDNYYQILSTFQFTN